MWRNKLVQLIALGVMVVSLVAAGNLLPSILAESRARTLRYTDDQMANAPPEVVLGTAIGAVKGIMVNVLWIRAQMMKDNGLYYEANTLAEMITRLQPRFAPVWAMLGHNMAYNISVATNTQAERWEWVRKGIDLVRQSGLRHNPNDVELHKELAFWFSHKIEGVSDDAHLYYKKEFCREWHNLLGPPPPDWAERTEWIAEIANAPKTLEEAEERAPGVQALVDALKERLSPFAAFYKFDLDRELLYAYDNWNSVKATWYARTLGTETRLRELAQSAETTQERDRALFFVALDELAADPTRAEQWRTLLAHVRNKVLREDYNMDPQLMYELTRDWGPIDWRHASAHALYWSMRGSKQAEARSQNDDDISKIINNDRMAAHAMQDLARFGNMSWDPSSNDVPSRLPDPRWIAGIEKYFTHLYIKHQEVDGWGSDNFIAWHQNFLESEVRELLRMGNRDKAEELFERLDSLYGRGHIPPNPQYAIGLEEFVQKKTYEEYHAQPHVATTDVQNAMYFGIRAGKARDNEELYEDARQFANDVLRYFKENAWSDFVNKFGEARIAGIIGDLENVEVATYWRIMVDSSIPLDERLRIYNLHTPEPIQRMIYDDIRAPIEQAVANSRLSQFALASLLPEPAGMAEYRAQREERMRQMMGDQGQAGQGERAVIER